MYWSSGLLIGRCDCMVMCGVVGGWGPVCSRVMSCRARACSELELRKSGAKGRVVVDDPTKYPGKDDIGPLGECWWRLTSGV